MTKTAKLLQLYSRSSSVRKTLLHIMLTINLIIEIIDYEGLNNYLLLWLFCLLCTLNFVAAELLKVDCEVLISGKIRFLLPKKYKWDMYDRRNIYYITILYAWPSTTFKLARQKKYAWLNPSIRYHIGLLDWMALQGFSGSFSNDNYISIIYKHDTSTNYT